MRFRLGNPLVTLLGVKKSQRSSLIAAVAVVSTLLTSCTPPGVEDPQKLAQEQAANNQTVSGALGGATPAQSPASEHPAGEVLRLEAPFDKATDIELSGDIFLVRAAEKIAIGTIDQLRTNSYKEMDIIKACGDVSVTGDTFVLPCPKPVDGAGGGTIYLIDAKNPSFKDTRRADMEFTSAALTTTGEVIGGSSNQPDVVMFSGSGSKKISTSRKADEMVSSAVSGTRDGVVFIEREKTVIQGVDFSNNRPGGALRMGVGVGSIAAGEEGLFLASDTLGHQLGVYTDDDILMLHQTVSTDPSPWAVAWDAKRKLAWVSSNATNKIQAFKISSGVPELQGAVDSVANVRSMTIDTDGNIYALSDSGAGLQYIPATDVDKQL